MNRLLIPSCLTSDLTVREHFELLRAAGYPWWLGLLPGLLVERITQ